MTKSYLIYTSSRRMGLELNYHSFQIRLSQIRRG